MNDKHTPGPWEVHCEIGEAHRSVAAGDRFVAHVYNSRLSDLGEANARLIAAAPELLAALRRFADAMERGRYPELQGVACDAFAAIAKAEGRA